MNPEIRVRIAPSPTGPLHIGTARTALFNWLFAKKNGGKFVLRVEDTDKERSEPRFEKELLEGLTWLGFDWDEGPLPDGTQKGEFGPYRQSERTDIYKKYLQQLLDDGNAYYCYCTTEDLEAQRQAMLAQGLPPKYSGHCRNVQSPPSDAKPQVIRFKVPETKVEFKDIIRGRVSFDAALFGDIVIAKDLDTPLYNFAVVVDDELMKISHVIRGEDHLSNTPKQILMERALGFREPIFAHIPLILNPDRSKMSKRFADVALSQYRAKGYLPEAIMNFLALLGWHPKDDNEILTKEELIAHFDLERVQQAGAVFNEEKLAWLNREYMKQLSDEAIAALLEPFLKEGNLTMPASAPNDFMERFIAVGRNRASTLRDFVDQGQFFFSLPDYDPELLVWKKATREEVAPALKEALDALTSVPSEKFNKESFLDVLSPVMEKRGRGTVLWPLRVSLSGQAASPDPFEIMEVLGEEESLRRIGLGVAKLTA